MLIEWPTPGLWPGVVGRKASIYPSRLLVALFCNWLGLKTERFFVLIIALLKETDFGEWLMLFLKLLPSMQRSSHEIRNKSTKSKQVRVKCAMVKLRFKCAGEKVIKKEC